MEYVRFEAPEPNSCGFRTGVFGPANGLAHSKGLSVEDWAWWRVNNDWFNDAYIDPGSIDATLFDHAAATCWFKESALHLLERIPGYLDLLTRYGVAWVERRSQNPGQILYDDEAQIVVVPSP